MDLTMTPRTPWTLTVMVCICTMATAQPAGSPLTNGDIIKMAKAGLSDTVIVGSINKSPHSFDTGPTALVSLKEAGVSNRIIEAMVRRSDLGHEAVTTVPPAALENLPTTYGWYVVSPDKLMELRAVPVVTVFGLTLKDKGYAVDGIANEHFLSVSTPEAILVYQQSTNVADIHLASLTFSRSMQAYEFNIGQTKPEFFAMLFHKGWNDIVPVNLWRPIRDVPLNVQPVEARPNMFKLIAGRPLVAGKYAVYLGDALHGNDLVFGAVIGRQAGAIAFEVGPSPEKAPPTSAPPLWSAALRADLATVTDLLDHGADVDQRTQSGVTALITASILGHEEIVRVLLAHGANANTRFSSGLTALHGAAYKGMTTVVALLIKGGADVNARTNAGATPLAEATRGHHSDIVRLLKEAGAR